MAKTTGPIAQDRRIGLRIRFEADLVPALGLEDEAITHTCDDRHDHWFVHDGRDDDPLPFLAVTLSRGTSHGFVPPPRVHVRPSCVGAWHYYCGRLELLADNGTVARGALPRPARLKQGAIEWMNAGHSGIALYLDTDEEWSLEVEGRADVRALGEGDELWLELHSEQPAYPLLEIRTNSVRLSYPAANTWYIDVLERVSKVGYERYGNTTRLHVPPPVVDPEPWESV